MTDGKRFERDLSVILERLAVDMTKEQLNKLNKLRDVLLHLHKENVVKITHSIMELVCAKFLILRDYDVQLEYPLNEILTCDLYAKKGYSNLIVEIETGFIPPEHAMDPLTYTYSRIASKIIRYSHFAGKFALGIPAHYILPLPGVLALPPRKRSAKDIEQIKNLCDWYYQDPPISVDGIRTARIHEIQIIDVDHTKVIELDPESYMSRALNKGVLFTMAEEQEIIRNRPLQSKFLAQTLDKYFE